MAQPRQIGINGLTHQQRRLGDDVGELARDAEHGRAMGAEQGACIQGAE